MLRIAEGETVLFQGDSITDADRARFYLDDLGRGYALMTAGWFGARYPERGVRFLNRGIGGDRVVDLLARWDDDCLALRPDVLSILVGINETWRAFDAGDPTPVEVFERDYRELLTRARDALPATRLILMEPFSLPISPAREAWRADLDPKIQAVRRLARAFGALLVPLDGLFAQAAARREATFWAEDGVHPTPAGHALIARAWLSAIGAQDA
ncbi:MAG TPA: SGNH/GDSL hydrolase family protein [Ktedonobacterales bacterium]|jgi:lysophospholipase L1-like esterase|nr:SGNH/GDSL hydrolase family protein [Ktedonobacterales bacterium]